MIVAIKALGQIERDLRHDQTARALYEEAVALCREDGHGLALAHTIRHLGDVHQDAGRFGLAGPCYKEALAIYRGESQPPPLELANAIRPLAMLKDELGEGDEARRLWQEAKELYEAVGVRSGVEECAERLGRRDHP